MQRIVISIALSFGLFIPSVWAYSGGTGEPNNPFQIATAQDLIDLGNDPCGYDKHYVQVNDIDLSGLTFDRAVIASDVNESSLPFNGAKFSGSFNGQGYLISHLSIQGGNYLGLFGCCCSGAIISNLVMESVDVNGTGDYVGALVGRNSSGTITSSYSTGRVHGDNCIGALVGWNSGVITSNYSTANVSGDNFVGGLLGYNYLGMITSSYSRGKVSGDGRVGGLVGLNHFGIIQSSYSTGKVDGDDWVGGLVGENQVRETSSGIITSFWDKETSGCGSSDGGIALSSDEMMNAEMLGLNGLCTDPNWVLDAGQDYAHLVWEGISGGGIPEPDIDWIKGAGTGEDPYQIESIAQLQLVSKAGGLMDCCFELVESLDLSEITWSQAVLPYFNGCFNGKGHVISHLVIEGAGKLGFFGILDSQAEVLNLGLEYVEINGSQDAVGGLVGRNSGIITSSYSTGSINGMGDFVGGLVGYNYSGMITSSYSTSDVRGEYFVGGIAGYNYSILTSIYSTGNVRGVGYVGGLVGRNYGDITASFWNTETSSLSKGSEGLGLATAEMQDIDTFLNAGWDLVGETANGTCNYWQKQVGDYPTLTVFTGALPDQPLGSGTADDPYLITDANNLGMVWCRSNACYRLDSDIDLAGISWNSAIIPGFGGQFEGDGHLILNLSMDGGGHLGLFGICTSRGNISNLVMESVDVNGTGDYVSGFVGRNYGIITSSSSTGSVIAMGDSVGGFVGRNDGNITSSYSNTSVSGTGDSVGGLVGWNDDILTLSCSDGSVSGTGDSVGGLVGRNDGSITSTNSTCSVSGDGWAGGLVGRNYGSTTRSYSTGNVSGGGAFGGLVGDNWLGIITSSYSTGNVSGDYSAGGFVGRNYGIITSSYSTGCVRGMWGYAGGLVGDNWSGGNSITSSFWDMDTSGHSESDGGRALNTGEMQNIEIFLDAGWDFVDEIANGTDDIWIMPDSGYPHLRWEF